MQRTQKQFKISAFRLTVVTNCTPTRWTDWNEVILWWVHGGVLEKPSYFSWKPCDETNQEVGIQMLCVCVCVWYMCLAWGLPLHFPVMSSLWLWFWSAACLCSRRSVCSSLAHFSSTLLSELCLGFFCICAVELWAGPFSPPDCLSGIVCVFVNLFGVSGAYCWVWMPRGVELPGLWPEINATRLT